MGFYTGFRVVAYHFPIQYEAVDKWSSRIASRRLYNQLFLAPPALPHHGDAQKELSREVEIVEQGARFIYPSFTHSAVLFFIL